MAFTAFREAAVSDTAREHEAFPVAARRAAYRLLDVLPDAYCLAACGGGVLHSNPVMHRLLTAVHSAELKAAMREVRRAIGGVRGGSSGGASGRDESSPTRLVAVGRSNYLVRAYGVQFTGGDSPLFVLVAVRSLIADDSDGSSLQTAFGLSRREAEVASLLACGLRNDVIAERLGISPFTARRHTERILGKLSVRTRSEAAAMIARLGHRSS